MTGAGTSVSVIIVSWNVLPLLRRCLASILSQLEAEQIIVVDNASADGSAEAVVAEFPYVHLVQAGGNLGYPAAVNMGASKANGEYLLILNPDTELQPGALAVMRRMLDRDPSAAVVAPRIICPDGSPQSSRRRFPSLRDLFLESTPLQRWLGLSHLLRRFYLAGVPASHAQGVDWAVGACLLLRRRALVEVGGLDANYFMYSEEVDICRRLAQLGWQVVYEPAAAVLHHEGKSSEQVPTARFIRFNRAKVVYASKYFGRRRAELLRLHLLFLFAGQMAEEVAKLFLRHKPELRQSRISAYRTVLRNGLRGGT